MTHDLALRGNAILTPDGMRKGVVLIKEGVIVDITDLPDATDCIDAGDNIIMSGVIDPHVHINEPGRTYWEGFETATYAALSGGVTTLVDMPLNSTPVTTTAAAFDEKIAATKNKLYTHCGFWGGIVPGNTHELEKLIDKGVLGFKAFLTHSGIDDFPNSTEHDLRMAMPILARHGLPLLVHCELSEERIAQSLTQHEKQSYQRYLASRPRAWENKAIALMIRLCEEYNCHVHIVHLSSAESIDPIRKAKQKGLQLTVETAQHYLYFNAEDIGDARTELKCAPPIRERENNDQLWGALLDGTIDFVATDHSPAPPDLKQLATGDFTTAWGGVSSIQFALPVLWTAARKRNINITHIAQWLSARPANLLGNSVKKGKIAKGYDADLIIWNPEKQFVVEEPMILHRHKVTPYLHEKLSGVVDHVFLKGKKVYHHGKAAQPAGELILAL